MWYIINYGIPHSLSSTYYIYKYKFSLTLILSSSLLFPTMINNTPENFKFLTFLMFSGTLFVAFVPDYDKFKFLDNIHTTAAIILLISSQIWVAVMNPFCLSWWVLLLIYVIYNFKINLLQIPKIKFFGEVIMLITIYNVLC